jgi:hypothetical protein
MLRLVLISIAGAVCATLSQPWPTLFGPLSGTSISLIKGPKAGVLQSHFLNSSTSWSSRYSLTGSPLLLSNFPTSSVILIAQKIIDSNYSLLSIDDNTGELIFETPLTVTDSSPGPYSNSCGISSAILDNCGNFAYVALACGPEPLSLNNYIFAIDLRNGFIAWHVSSFGTGSFATLASSSLCESLYTTFGSRDSPLYGVRLSAENGTSIETFSASISNFNGLEPQSAFFTVSSTETHGIDVLVLANEPSHPFTALYRIVSTAQVNPKAFLVNMSIGSEGITDYHKYRFIPQLLITDSKGPSVIASFDPEWNKKDDFIVWRYSQSINTKLLEWQSNITPSSFNGTISSIGYSSITNTLILSVEYFQEYSEIFFINALTGTIAPTKCIFKDETSPTSSTILRSLVIDDTANGGPILAVLEIKSINKINDNGKYYTGQYNMTEIFLTTIRLDLSSSSSSCSIITRLNLLNSLDLISPILAPTDFPNTSGLLPHFWPLIAIGPKEGEYTILIHACCVLTVTSAQ